MANEKPRYDVNETVLITKTNEKAVVREIIIDKEHNFYGVRLAVFKPHGFDDVTLKLNEIEKVKRPAPKDWFEDEDVVYFARLTDTAIIPTKEDHNAGFDVYCDLHDDELLIRPHEVVLVPTGIASACHPKYYLNFANERSSTGKIGLSVLAGIVDSSYRGPILLELLNVSERNIVISKHVNQVENREDAVYYPHSKAVAQMILYPVPKTKSKVIPAQKLESIPSQRGKNGFGSSGK